MKKWFNMNHERRKKIVTPLSLLLFFLGSLWISLLATICVTTGELKPRGTYVSDNALLPAGAFTDVSSEDMLARVFPSSSGVHDIGFPPLKGILLKSRFASDRREAMCFVAQEGRGDDVLYALARMFTRARWLSKDVFLIVLPRNETLATRPTSPPPLLRRWLESYHMDVFNDRLKRAGPIRGAIVIDIPPDVGGKDQVPLSREAVLVQGMDGRLPNMDFINVARLTVPAFAAHSQSLFDLKERNEHLDKSTHGIRFATDILLGPTGWHGEFLQFQVESLTLKSSISSSGSLDRRGRTRLEFAERLEKMARSLSTISEKFNRSFFFYVMLSLDSFVSIDEFLWAFIVFIFPLAVDAFFVAATPNRNGFRESLGAITSLSMAVIWGCVVLMLFDSLPIPPALIWIGSVICFAVGERYQTNRKADIGECSELPSWRYKRSIMEVFIFISLAALGVVHFPLALLAAALCYPSARLVTPWPKGSATKIVAYLMLCGLFLVTISSLLIQDRISLYVPLSVADMRTLVLYLVVLPSHMITASIMIAPVVANEEEGHSALSLKKIQ